MPILIDNSDQIYQFTILGIFLIAIVFFLAMYWYAQSLQRAMRIEDQTRQDLLVNSLELDKSRLKNSILEAQSSASAERTKRLELEASLHNNELISNTLLLSRHSQIMTDIEKMVIEGGATEQINEPTLSRLKQRLRESLRLDEGWASFRDHFLKIHPDFFDNLERQYPRLTQNDLRHCAYIRMRLTTKEIARLLGINPTSVQISRVRLKKKMNLPKEVDLIKFIADY